MSSKDSAVVLWKPSTEPTESHTVGIISTPCDPYYVNGYLHCRAMEEYSKRVGCMCGKHDTPVNGGMPRHICRLNPIIIAQGTQPIKFIT